MSLARGLGKLFLFGRAAQRGGGAFAACENLCHFIEVAGANLVLVLCCAVTVGLSRKLRLLELGICAHADFGIAVRELEHGVIERMKSSQRYKLKFVTHCRELALEFRDRRVVEFLLPVERRRTIISQQLVWKLVAHHFCETLRLAEIGRARFAPDEVRIR